MVAINRFYNPIPSAKSTLQQGAACGGVFGLINAAARAFLIACHAYI
jgi:hypothetical protein